MYQPYILFSENTLYFHVMGKPSNRRRARRVENRGNLQRTVAVPSSINCAIWNCNGLIRDTKQDMIVEVMEVTV